MSDGSSPVTTTGTPGPRTGVRPVKRALLLAATALTLLVWSATLEVVCAAAGGGSGDALVMVPSCPPQSARVAAAGVSAGVVVVSLVLLLVVRRRAWARRPGAERWLFVAFAVVTALAFLGALFSTGFAPMI